MAKTVPTKTPPAAPGSVADLLARHEDAVTVTVAGREFRWLLGRRAFRLARAAGTPVEAVVDKITALQGDGPAARGMSALERVLDAYGHLVWLGALTYDDTLAPDDVADLLTPADIPRIGPAMLGALFTTVGEGGEGKAGAPESA